MQNQFLSNKLKRRLEQTEFTSMQIIVVTCAPMLTTHAEDSPFPKTAARPSCDNPNFKKNYPFTKVPANK